METNKTNQVKNVIIAVLSLLLVGSIFYNFQQKNDTQLCQAESTKIISEKESVLNDLKALKVTYDQAINDKTAISDELIAERTKVENLISELQKSKVSKQSVSKYKNMYFELESKMNSLVAENEVLKKDNLALCQQRDSIKIAETEAKKANETLASTNVDLTSKVQKAAKLKVSNLKTVAFKQRNSGKLVDTEKASRADILQISFTLAENELAQAGEKSYNIQVIDSENNVIGEKKEVVFGDKTLTYSFEKKVNYENKTVEVTEDLPVKDIVKGTYFVNIFDQDQLVSKTSFALR